MYLSKNILIGVSGSIAAYKVCEVISTLQKQGARVRVVATESALNFVGAATFEGLTGHPVLTNDFIEGSMMAHIELAKWADLFLIAPATAQTVNSLAQGVGHGILLSTYLAYDVKKPFLLAPAMNTQMLLHPTTQASLLTLQKNGARVLATGDGPLACGDVGAGRLLEPQTIVQAVIDQLSVPRKNKAILVTAGGTRVPVDSVRSLTNSSSGATGVAVADELSQQGYDVVLLLSQSSPHRPRYATPLTFDTYEDLYSLMKTQLGEGRFSGVVHAAAVSDFTVSQMPQGKLVSGQERALQLEPTEKIISKIRSWSPRPLQLVGFKLTDTLSVDEHALAREKVFASGADWVVHNDLSEITATEHTFRIFDRRSLLDTVHGKNSLGSALAKIFESAESITPPHFSQQELI